MKPTLLIMAAGMGSRYGGLKQIDPVGPSGEIIIDYAIYDAIRAGFGKVVFVIRKDIETAFRETIGNRYADKVEIEYAYQELDMLPEGFSIPEGREKPWGTGHAVLVAQSKINEPFVAMNADDFYGRSAYQSLAEHLTNAKDGEFADYSMVGYTLRNTLSDFGTVSRGVCYSDGEGCLKNVVERTKIEREGSGARYLDEQENWVSLTGDEIVSMNIWGFTPSIFDHLNCQFKDFLKERGNELKSEFFSPTVVNNLINDDLAKVRILGSDAQWFGITYPQDKHYVIDSIRKLIAQDEYPEKLF